MISEMYVQVRDHLIIHWGGNDMTSVGGLKLILIVNMQKPCLCVVHPAVDSWQSEGVGE